MLWRDGLKIKYRCHRCGGTLRNGTVRSSGPAWDVEMDCGHTHRAGWKMPVDELRKKGLVTTETPVDPRKVSADRQKQEDKMRQIKELQEFEKRKQDFTTPKFA